VPSTAIQLPCGPSSEALISSLYQLLLQPPTHHEFSPRCETRIETSVDGSASYSADESRILLTAFRPVEPRVDATETACLDGTERCQEYTGFVYAEYDADPSTDVAIRVSQRGENSWWVGGWSRNVYSDAMSTSLEGPRGNWVTVEGVIDGLRGS